VLTANLPTTYAWHWLGRGWRQGNDHFYVDFNMSWAVPLGLKSFFSRAQMIGEINVYNLFNARIYNDSFYNSYYSDNNGYFRFDNRGGQYIFGTTFPINNAYSRAARRIDTSLGIRF